MVDYHRLNIMFQSRRVQFGVFIDDFKKSIADAAADRVIPEGHFRAFA